MGRYKNRVGHSQENGLPNKRDTPVKATLNRRDKCRRLLVSKRYEAVPEEPELEETYDPNVKPTHPVMSKTRIKPAHCKSVLHLSSPAFTENPRAKAISHAVTTKKTSSYQQSSTDHLSIWMPPEPKACEGDEMPVKEEDQNLTVTLGSVTSSSMESDTTFSSGDEDDEDSVCSTSNSLPSPEIFRRESDVETPAFPVKGELPGHHVHIKNSTLLDVSHAENIHMYQPPNLSNIMDASTILVEKNFEINKNRGPEAETKIHVNSFKTEKEQKTPIKHTNRRPILYKKKVWFKSPITAENLEAIHRPATKLTNHNSNELAHMSSTAGQMQSNMDTSRVGEISFKEETLRPTMSLKIPVKSNLIKAKFFDFVNDSDRDAFFERMRERCVKLRSAPLFPLTAPKYTEPSVL